jgi:hypothetical protein
MKNINERHVITPHKVGEFSSQHSYANPASIMLVNSTNKKVNEYFIVYVLIRVESWIREKK